MVVHLFLNNNKALDFLPINSIKNGGITESRRKYIHPELKQGQISLNILRCSTIQKADMAPIVSVLH